MLGQRSRREAGQQTQQHQHLNFTLEPKPKSVRLNCLKQVRVVSPGGQLACPTALPNRPARSSREQTSHLRPIRQESVAASSGFLSLWKLCLTPTTLVPSTLHERLCPPKALILCQIDLSGVTLAARRRAQEASRPKLIPGVPQQFLLALCRPRVPFAQERQTRPDQTRLPQHQRQPKRQQGDLEQLELLKDLDSPPIPTAPSVPRYFHLLRIAPRLIRHPAPPCGPSAKQTFLAY
ncbi:hypothetical protein B0H67DRAFT_338329 [Lasiosphaeris hirsuta]|uniref:Uncharacterized protein n=1 Tax=Lasiosphaeris hirsuta TaxID=260670 RepID=A0AA40A305_9PEZI|nr:hypothetical protein B0H67DRAFT_338329 [Lasiosphaeris hirsuta]